MHRRVCCCPIAAGISKTKRQRPRLNTVTAGNSKSILRQLSGSVPGGERQYSGLSLTSQELKREAVSFRLFLVFPGSCKIGVHIHQDISFRQMSEGYVCQLVGEIEGNMCGVFRILAQ